MGRSTALAAVLLAALAAAPRAMAQPVDDATRLTARALGEEGLAHLEVGRHAEALERFDRALKLVQAPTLSIYAARSAIALGRLVEASERYRLAAAMPIDPAAPAEFQQTQREAQETARIEREALVARIPSVVIRLEGAEPRDVELAIDGAAVPNAAVGVKRPIDPGPHAFEAKRGADVARVSARVEEGGTAEVVLKLPVRASPPPPPLVTPAAPPSRERPATSDGSTQRIFGWMGVGIGGASLVVGVVSYAIALNKASYLESECPGKVNCTSGLQGDVDSYDAFRTAALVTLAGGVIVGGVGMALVLTAPSGSAPGTALRAGAGPNGGSLLLTRSF